MNRGLFPLSPRHTPPFPVTSHASLKTNILIPNLTDWHNSFTETVCYRCRSSYGYRDRFDDRFSYRSGYSGSSYGYGSERCVYCERLRFEGPGYHHGGVSICRDRYGRPALCRPRRVLVEKKTVKKYYY